MAAIPYVIEEPDTGPAAGAAGSRAVQPPGSYVVKWTLLNGQTGQSFITPIHSDKSIIVSGVAGAGFAGTIEVSDVPSEAEAADATFVTARDAGGSAVAFTGVPAGVQLLENTTRFRPKVTAGDGSTAVVVRATIVTPARR